MSSTVIITIIVCLIILSIVISAVSYSRQQAISKRKKEIQKQRRQADELGGHVHLLQQIDAQYSLLTLLQGYAVNALSKAHDLDSNDVQVAQLLQSQKAILEQFKEGTRPNEYTGYLESDQELSKAHFSLTQIGKVIDISNRNHTLSKAQAQDLKNYIQRLKLDIDINSHLKQAEKYGQNSDVVMYQLHIKQALNALKKASIEMEDKNKRIKELSDILAESKKTNKVIISEQD